MIEPYVDADVTRTIAESLGKALDKAVLWSPAPKRIRRTRTWD